MATTVDIDALTQIACSLRADWTHPDVRQQVISLSLYRDWDSVVASTIFAARDRNCRKPSAIKSWRDAAQVPTRTPPPVAEVFSLDDRRDALSGDAAHRKADEARAMLRGDDPA